MRIRVTQPSLLALVNIRHIEASTTAITLKLRMSMMITMAYTNGLATLLVAVAYEGAKYNLKDNRSPQYSKVSE